MTDEAKNNVPSLSLFGVSIPDDPQVIAPRIRRAIVQGWYEKTEVRQFEGFSSPGDRIIEVGSGIGFLSTIMSRDPNVAEILCFEANPQLIEFSRRVHQMNDAKNVRIENALMTTEAGAAKQTFYLREAFWESSVFPGPLGYQSEATIPTRQLADAIAEFRPTMIVCDIEGGEDNLFETADLPGVDRLLMEVHTELVGLKRVGKLFNSLGQMGFVYDQKHSSRNVVGFRRS